MKTTSTATTVDPAFLASLRQSWHGDLIRPGDPVYDEARTLWNAMIDRRPAIIARAADTSDVLRGVIFARDHGLSEVKRCYDPNNLFQVNQNIQPA